MTQATSPLATEFDKSAGSSKTFAAYETLRQDILDVILQPTTPLRIKDLSKTYGFGWTPLREALSRLEVDGLVISEHNRGFFVAPVSLQDFQDLQRTRVVIESDLLREAIEKGDAKWEDGIVGAHYRLSRTPYPDDPNDTPAAHEWELRHQAFHDALLAAAQGAMLIRIREQVNAQMLRTRRALIRQLLGPKTPALSEEQKLSLHGAMGIEHHSLLMDATLKRDAVQATTLLHDHAQLSLTALRSLGTPRT